MFLRKHCLCSIFAISLVNICLIANAKPINNQETCIDKDCNETKWSSNKPTPQELCKFCDLMMPIARYLIDKNETKLFPTIAVFICNELKLADDVVCKYAINAYEVLNEFFLNKHLSINYKNQYYFVKDVCIEYYKCCSHRYERLVLNRTRVC